MLLFDNMAAYMNGKKALENMTIDYNLNKDGFLNVIVQSLFQKFRLFFIKLIFMYGVGKCPKHTGSDSLPLLHPCRDPMES